MRIGLTGGIGSGKSTVSSMLVELGAALVDTDALSRSLTSAGGAAIPAIERAFGAAMVDAGGALDRAAMRDLVFRDPQAKAQLEGIVHPLIQHACLRAVEDAPAHATIVFDVPLLVESGRWRAQVDRVLVVDCDPATQVARVMARSGWSREQTERVIASQASRATRLQAADAVIANDGIGLDHLRRHCVHLWARWGRPH